MKVEGLELPQPPHDMRPCNRVNAEVAESREGERKKLGFLGSIQAK